jgi:hypothetical protein
VTIGNSSFFFEHEAINRRTMAIITIWFAFINWILMKVNEMKI